MHRTRLRRMSLVLTVVVVIIGPLTVTGAQQHSQLESYHTPNLPSATVRAAEENHVWGEGRFFGGGGCTLSAGLSMRAGEGAEAQFTLFTMDTSVEGAAEEKIEFSGTLLGLNYKWLSHQDERMAAAVISGIEYPIERLKAERAETGDSARTDRLIPVFAVPLEWHDNDDTTWRIVPRYIGHEDRLWSYQPDGTQEGRVDGLGQSISVGVGVVHEQPDYSLMADLQLPITGHNSMSTETNEPTRVLTWSGGGSWHGVNSALRVDIFATNAFGPTAASSLVANPDGAGFGLRVSGEF